MENAFELFVRNFPPAENLQAANGFKSFDEICSLLEQWGSGDLDPALTRECLTSNGYVTEVIGDKVVYLVIDN